MPDWQQAHIQEMHLKPPVIPRGMMAPLAWRIAGQGSEITVNFRPLPFLPIRLHWTALIERFDWERRRFTDVQTSGPFESWKHCHTVEEHIDGGSTVIDEIEYIPPAKKLGDAANDLLLRQIKRAFAARQENLSALLFQMLGPL